MTLLFQGDYSAKAAFTIPFEGRPFVVGGEQLCIKPKEAKGWAAVLEAVHAVTAQRPSLRSETRLVPELEPHFLSRD